MSRTTSIAAAITGVSLVAAAIVGGSAAASAPSNDNFGDAIALTGESWSASINNTAATTEGGEATGSDATSIRTSSVWLEWTPEAARSVTIIGDKGFGVGVFTGDSVANATEVAFGATQVTLDAVAGETYSIQVSSLGDAPTGDATVTLASAEATRSSQKSAPEPQQSPTLAAAPANDSFANAQKVSGAGVYALLSLLDATTEPGEQTTIAGGLRLYNTVWLRWTAPANGSATFDTLESPSSADTALALYTGTSFKNDKRIAVNDDTNSDFRASLSSIKVKKGVTYRIQVGVSGFGAPSTTPGNVDLRINGVWTKPANDDKSSAVATSGSKWTATGTTVGATMEIFEEPANPLNSEFPLHNSIWYKWKASSVGNLSLSTLGSSNDTALRVFRDSPNNGLVSIAFNDDAEGGGSHAALPAVPVAPGYTYYIAVYNPIFMANGSFGYPGAIRLAGSVTYTAPAITSISPTSGKLAGGGTITITGIRLTDVKNVRFGNVYATNVTVVSPTKVTATIPAGVKKGKVAVIAATIWNVGNPVHAKTYYTYK